MRNGGQSMIDRRRSGARNVRAHWNFRDAVADYWRLAGVRVNDDVELERGGEVTRGRPRASNRGDRENAVLVNRAR